MASGEALYALEDLLYLMSRLREPVYGCPWDLAQSYQSIAPSTLEEAYEVVDAIEHGDRQQLREELGDWLFQVVFYSQLGREEQAFEFSDIVHDITSKLLRRHPHVFPEGTLESRIDPNNRPEPETANAGIKASWEKIKQHERQVKGHTSIMDDIPTAFPAAVRAVKLQKRAASIGFDWKDDAGVYDKLQEEISELQEAQHSQSKDAIEDELGDLLFTVINLARHLKVDPETALRKSNSKFEQRFRTMELQCTDFSGRTEQELEQYWQQAKATLAAKTTQ